MVPFVRLEKCRKMEEATDANMAHTHCMMGTKATNTHLEYVILTDFPLQHWLYRLTSQLHYTYIACLV